MFDKNHPITIEFNTKILFTNTHFGDNEDLRTAKFTLFEKNINGDCLCLVNDQYLVDIDNRDIKSYKILETPGDRYEKAIHEILNCTRCKK